MLPGIAETASNKPALPRSRWRLKERDLLAEAELQRELGVPEGISALLVQRGLVHPAQVQRFLNPRLDDLHDPRRLPDYAKAAEAILGARERNETIYIHGDYDVDGVTSAALLTRFLSKIGCRVETKVPNRFKDGYGVSPESVREAHAMGAKLFLTCDCGVGALEETDLAHELGMKVVVTDHHTIPEQLPRAEAIVNPHRADSEYPFRMLSGAGIAFKLGLGLTRELDLPQESYLNAYLDLAALGTIADVMPLADENRILAKFGLERLYDSKKPGLAALMSASGLREKAKGKLKSWHVGFILGPRLNASGRIDDAKLSLSLLLSQDATESYELAKRIEDLNETRKREQEQLIEEAIEKVIATGADRHAMIVISGEGWHEGVLGIVAGKLRERFCRPVFVLSSDPETGWTKGSGRSVPEVNLAEAIRAHPNLVRGGGHAAAAGISLETANLPQVQAAMHEYASKFLTEEDFVPVADADLEVPPEAIDMRLLEALGRFEPFGVSNPEPTFVSRGVFIDQVIPTRNPDHPQIMIRAEGLPAMRAPAFGMGDALRGFSGGFAADVLYRPALDEYNGVVRVKWEIRDLAPV